MSNEMKNWDADDVQMLVEEAISECNENGVEVDEVETFEDYFTVKINNDLSLNTINAIARKVKSKYITVGAEDSFLTLFFKPGMSSDWEFDDDDDDNEQYREPEEPHIPDNMRHTDRFYDAEDVVIPGTEQRVSNTEQNEQIVAWIEETGHTPIVFVRLDDGIHVEVSDLFDRKVKAVLSEGHAVGGDARRYTFEKPHPDFFPIGGSICVRAICDETGRSDVYGLDFFV